MKVRYEVCTMPGGRRSNQDRWVVGRSVVEEREKTSGVWDTEVEPLLTAVLDGVGGCVYRNWQARLQPTSLGRSFILPSARTAA